MYMSTEQLSDELCIATTEKIFFEMDYGFALRSVRKLKMLHMRIQNISSYGQRLLRSCPLLLPCVGPGAHVAAQQVVSEK